jgi:hypothetical protein
MNKNNKSLNKFSNDIDARLAKAEALLYQDRASEAKDQLDWIESAKKIKEYKQEKKKYYWSVLIALTSILVISLAIGLKVPSTYISVELIVHGINVRLKGDTNKAVFENSTFKASGIYMDQLIFFDEMPYDMAVLANKDVGREQFHVSVEGQGVKLEELRAIERQKATKLSISVFKDAAQFYFNGLGLGGQLRVKLPAEVNVEGEESLLKVDSNKQLNPPVSMFFRTAAPVSGGIPINFSLSKNVRWEVKNIDIYSLSFLEEVPPGSGIHKSTVESGSVNLLEMDTERPLSRGNYLYVECIECQRYSLTGDGDAIRVLLQGKVRKVIGGTPGYKVNYMPSYIEYIYYNQRLAIVWSAIIFVWGLLWAMKRSFTR